MSTFEIPQARPCCPRCGGRTATITERGAQDVVRCATDDAYLYCAPRRETGKPTRKVNGRSVVPPKVRWRVLERFGHSCIGCGATGVELHVDHIIPLDAAERFEFVDRELLDGEVNLGALCEACNLGKSASAPSIRLMYRCLQIHQLQRGGE